MSRFSTTILLSASLASLALARTDLTGCTSTDVSSPAGASIAWYVPGTGELCIIPDCGGGRAPPKPTAPGCNGNPEVTSYLPGYGSMTASVAQSTSSAEASGSASQGVVPALTYTSTGAWSETSETNTSLENLPEEITSYQTASASAAESSMSSTMSTMTSAPAVGMPVGSTNSNGTATNGTTTGSGSGSGSSGNGTSSASPSPIQSDSGAMATARVWLGGSALVGLGALVAAL